MLPLTSGEYDCLRSKHQRFHLYVAVFGTYQLWVKTRKRDATSERTVNQSDWKPIVNIGPHRMTFVGESITFDALDSCKITFDNQNGRTHGDGQDQGYGKGDLGTQTFDWLLFSVPNSDAHDADPGTATNTRSNQNWDTPQSYTFGSPGLYRLQVRDHGESDFTKAYANRWIRVYQDRQHLGWSVTDVQNMQGSWGDGWKAQLTIRDSDITPSDTGISKFQCIGLYCEDEWLQGGTFVTQNIGNTRQDPTLVMVGTAVDGSIVVDQMTKQTSVNIETIDGPLGRSMSHKLAVWRARGPSDANTTSNNHGTQNNGTGTQIPGTKASANNVDTTSASGLSDTWGALLKGFRMVATTDLVTYTLQMRTNALPWHDYYAIWNHELGKMESAAGEETSVLSNMQTVAKNDWLVGCGGHEGAIIYGPDRQVTLDRKVQDGVYLPCWEKQWQIRMDFDEGLVWKATLNQALEKKVKYVRLIAENTKKPDKQIVADVPRHLPRDEPGTWEVQKGLIYDNGDAKKILRHKANSIFRVKNLIWTVQLDTGLNRAIRPGDYVRLSLDASTFWNLKKFLVKQVSHDIDLQHWAWKTSFQLEEAVYHENTPTLTAHCTCQVS